MNTTGQPAVIRFNRIRVKDIVAFEAVHAEALIAQGTHGVSERVYQSVDDKNDLTVQTIGTEQAMQDWLQSPERAALRSRLELDGTPETWLSQEAFQLPGDT